MRKLLRGVAAAVVLIVLLTATPLAATNQETAVPKIWDKEGQSWHLNQNRWNGICWPDTRDLRALESLIVAKGCLDNARGYFSQGIWKLPCALQYKMEGIKLIGGATHPLQDKDGHNDDLTAWLDLSGWDLRCIGIPRVEGTWAHGEPPFDQFPIIYTIFPVFLPVQGGYYADDVYYVYTDKYGVEQEHFKDALKSRDETWDVLSRFNQAYRDVFDRWI